MITRLFILATAVCLLITAAAPASRPGVSQRVDVRLTLPTPATTAHLCVDDDCELVEFGGPQTSSITLGLEYRLRNDLRTPSVVAQAGLPVVCQVRGPGGIVTRRPGAAIRVTGAALQSLALDVKRDSEKVKAREDLLATETQTTEVRLCVG